MLVAARPATPIPPARPGGPCLQPNHTALHARWAIYGATITSTQVAHESFYLLANHREHDGIDGHVAKGGHSAISEFTAGDRHRCEASTAPADGSTVRERSYCPWYHAVNTDHQRSVLCHELVDTVTLTNYYNIHCLII